MTRRLAIQLVILTVLGVVAAGWSYAFMTTQRDAHRNARADLNDCRAMAARLRQVADKSSTPCPANPDLDTQVIGRIEQMARKAGIPDTGLKLINPTPPLRVGNSSYMEKPTLVMLGDVTLRQFVTLVHGLIGPESGLHAKSIRLAARRADDTSDCWSAEVTLTRLIYAPPQSLPGGRR